MSIKKTLRIICIALAFSILFTSTSGAAGISLFRRQSLAKPEGDVRFSTSLSGDLSASLEIIGVTVVPLFNSGNVTYEPSDINSSKKDIGALIHMYIKNKSEQPINPQVTFNGKTACELIDLADNTVSWANTPDTRANRKYDTQRPSADPGNPEFAGFIPLTTEIPAGAVDCYSINICDAKFLYNGIDFRITADGKTAAAKIYGDYQYVDVARLMWRSTTDQKYYPDELVYYIDNKSSKSTKINYVNFYDGTEEYNLHYWNEASQKISSFNNAGDVPANQPACGTVRFGSPLTFKEYLVEFNITNNGRTYSIIQKTKPLILAFDISAGWGTIENEYYIKAISSMHLNSVIGAYYSTYYLRSKEFRVKYPIKIDSFPPNGPIGPEMLIDNGYVKVHSIDDVSVMQSFGEVQLSDNAENFQPMRVFNILLLYRNSPVPTNVTLTHEPAFFRFAGLSDLIHYDAYRVVAPFSDPWYLYFEYAKQEKYGLYWGAPLETTGDYMRTLAKLNYPNPVAAWTQGPRTWKGVKRFTKDPAFYYSPNPFELRIQAYENVANGATQLYWFNLELDDLLFNKTGLKEMRFVNRELRVLEDYLPQQVPYYYQRSNNYDVNLNMSKDCALLYVADLNYAAKDSMYQYKGMRPSQTFTFNVPAYLSQAESVVKVTKDGVSPVNNAVFSSGKVTLTDDVDMTALYVLGKQGIYSELSAKYNEILARETFNYLDNEALFQELQSAAGYSDENPFIPDTYEEQNTQQIRIVYALAGLIIHPLERMLMKLAAAVYKITWPFF